MQQKSDSTLESYVRDVYVRCAGLHSEVDRLVVRRHRGLLEGLAQRRLRINGLERSVWWG